MIKAILRPQRTQLKPTFFKWTSGYPFLDLRPYKTLGYKDIDLFCVGGAGGRSGRAGGNGYRTVFEAGGGGGASMRRKFKLKDCPNKLGIVVGTRGAKGYDVGASGGGQVNAGTGGIGGTSQIYDAIVGSGALCIATGGYGGRGGYVMANGGLGGSGGGEGGGTGQQGVYSNGTWDDNSLQGTGGWGGQGYITDFAFNVVQAGADGATGGGAGQYGAPGEGPESGLIGGTGGGANAYPMQGISEYYGTRNNNGANWTPDGVVIIRIT